VINKQRHASKYFRTKTEANLAEQDKRMELRSPPKEKMPTGMAFLELVNLRLDHVKAYNSVKHYQDYFYMARRWIELWQDKMCDEFTHDLIQRFILERRKVSPNTANKEIRYLRATFNFGKKKRYIKDNPVDGIEFLPTDRKVRYVPNQNDIDKVIEAADPDTQDYLWTVRETMGRMSEINALTWEDVNLNERYVILYTRKKRGGHRTPRFVPMTQQLQEILERRYAQRDTTKPWVFWHRYCSSKTGEWNEGPYDDRKRIMKTLCKKAGVKYFRYHALRHAGASIMENSNVPIGAIQEILGHENRSTTEIYLHNLRGGSRKAIEAYELAREKNKNESTQIPL
jgi:integrase